MARTLITRLNKDYRVSSSEEFVNLRNAGNHVFWLPNDLLNSLRSYVHSEIENGSLAVEDIVDSDNLVDPEYFHSQAGIADLLGHLIEVLAEPPTHTVTILVSNVQAEDEGEAERLVKRHLDYLDRNWEIQVDAEED